MTKITISLSMLFLIFACSSKKTETAISSGDYDTAIQVSVKKLRKSKTKKSSQKMIVLLEEAFAKAVERDHRNLERYKTNANPRAIKSIYDTYLELDRRQDIIRPLLPLYINEEGRDASFKFENYFDRIEASKKTLSEYLYTQAKTLLSQRDTQDARKAYGVLSDLNDINPGYKDVRSLLKDAHFQGTNFIIVNVGNDTNQVIPKKLEEDLLNFSTYGVNQFWKIFHSTNDPQINYNYKLELLFKRIDVSPEQLKEKATVLKKEIKDGFEYVLDSKGNVATDSLGNSLKRDKFITVTAKYIEVHQEKASHISASVTLIDLQSNQVVDTFPIESEFVFSYDFAEVEGDKRALNKEELEMIRLREIPFPTSEQMIFDTGEDLKNKFKQIMDGLDL